MTRTQRIVALLMTVPLGIAVRYAPLHLPWVVSKYAGSALWAVALYLLVAVIAPRHTPAVAASIVAVLVELSRLVPEPHVDHFRTTLAGKLLLGRYFSWKNILAYLVSIALAALLDNKLATRK